MPSMPFWSWYLDENFGDSRPLNEEENMYMYVLQSLGNLYNVPMYMYVLTHLVLTWEYKK